MNNPDVFLNQRPLKFSSIFLWKLWWFEKKNYPHFLEFIGQILSLCRHWNIVKFSFFRSEKFKPSVLWDFDDFRNTKRHCAHKIVTCRSVPVLKWWISYKVSRKDTQNSDFYVPKCRFDLSFNSSLILNYSLFWNWAFLDQSWEQSLIWTWKMSFQAK